MNPPGRRRKADYDGTVIEDLVPHLLSIVHMLLGKRALSELAVSSGEAKTQAQICFQYGGIDVAMHVDRDIIKEQKTRSVHVRGPEAEIDLDLIKKNVIIKDKTGRVINRYDARYPTELLHRHRDGLTPLEREFRAFFESVHTRRPSRNAAGLTDWIPEAMDRMRRAF